MDRFPEPIFRKKINNISWKKIYSREYGVQYSEMAILCLSPKAKYHIPSPSINQVIIPDGNNSSFYIDANSWKNLVESLNQKYTLHLNKLREYEEGFEVDGNSYLNFAKKISGEKFGNKSNKELLKLYIAYQNKLFAYSVYTWTAFILNNYVAERAMNILNNYLQEHGMEAKKQEVIDSLFQPVKYAAVIRLQKEIEAYKGNLPEKEADDFYIKYRWLSCLDLHNIPWNKSQFAETIGAFKKQTFKTRKPFGWYKNKLKINKNDMQYLEMAQRFIYIKDARDDFRRQGVFYVLPFFAEIAKRMGLDNRDISYVKSSEITDFLRNGKSVAEKIIKEREKSFIMYLDKNNSIAVISGEEIASVLKKYNLSGLGMMETKIRGTVASEGRAEGVVAIVHGVKDLHKVKKGNILVAITTHPDYTVAMRKAAAIVTDEGGITSHAAIVSREYGIPCIVGTKNASKILKDGDRVEVDAVEGIVRKIKQEI